MTVKKHTPSGAQSSTSARTQTRPATPTRPNGKAAAFDETMDAQVRAIVESPDVEESVKTRLDHLVSRLGKMLDASTLPDIPETAIVEYEAVAGYYLGAEGGGELPAEAPDAYAKLAAFAERHEPRDARLVRYLSAILRDPTEVEREHVLVAVNNLSNTLGVGDLHPEIFPTVARVLIGDARAFLRDPARKGSHAARVVRESLRDLEGVTGESGQRRAAAHAEDEDLARRIYAAAFPTEESREGGENGGVRQGGALDVATTLMGELEIYTAHPDVFRAALPILIRRIREIEAAGKPTPYQRRLLKEFAKVRRAAGA